MKKYFVVILLFLFPACSWKPKTVEYQQQYVYLENVKSIPNVIKESEYYIIFLVDAKHLDYTDSQTLLKTFTKHPTNASKECSFGHAWIILKGKDFFLEGGHSGELGLLKPRYVEGIQDLIQKGDENPISYLWESLEDGFFQKGNGGHNPTFAVKINLTEEEFENIQSFIKCYPYKHYSLCARQCVTFIKQIAAIININFHTDFTLPLKKYLKIQSQNYPLWSDDQYSSITFSSPETLERSLIKLVLIGKGENALKWYKKRFKVDQEALIKKLKYFPYRWKRYNSINL